MKDFLIKLDRSNTGQYFKISSDGNNNTDIFLPEKTNYFVRKNPNNSNLVIWIGDPVYEHKLPGESGEVNPKELLNIGGHFYCLSIENKVIKCFSNFMNILPIFYYSDSHFDYVSSSLWLIASALKNTQLKLSKRFILEQLLFNYPLGNKSILEGITMIPSGSYLLLNKGIKICQYFSVNDFLVENPKPWRKTIDETSELFISRTSLYLPEEPYALSFTSGFDGRVLTGISLLKQKNFSTYSFGVKGIDDINIPMAQSSKLGISYTPFFLDTDSFNNSFSENAHELLFSSYGLGNWERAQYGFALNQLAQNNRYILSGTYGSELFRAVHNTGVIIMPVLFDLFNSTDTNRVIEQLKHRPELKFLRIEEFQSELIDLQNDLSRTPYFQNTQNLNRRFYQFILGEMFRKYFGAEVLLFASKVLFRTPFIDPVFVQHLLQTESAGVYSKFYENRLHKRFKGLLPYARILQKSSPVLYNLMTGRGYSPKHLQQPLGPIKLLAGVLQKKYLRKNSIDDPFSIKRVINSNLKCIYKQTENLEFFNPDYLIRNSIDDYYDINNIGHILGYNSINSYIKDIHSE